ncbi:MAG: hypothetical protein IPM55_02465 [Acidobacteria bacterium]|nr:hypothetical protein [Acidobacteriota bacterium]
MKTRSYIQSHPSKKAQKPSRQKTAGRLKTEKPVKASRVKLPPPEVGHLIELVNLIPEDYRDLPDLRGELPGSRDKGELILREGASFGSERHFLLSRDSIEKLILREAERFPQPIREFLEIPDGISPDASTVEIYDILTETDRERLQERYQHITDGKTLLSAIAAHQERGSGHRFVWNAFSYPVWWHEDEEGKLQVSLSPLVSVLRGIDISRIRQCLACNKIFWAGRRNQIVCSEPCGHVLRNRRYRKAYQERYKLQRIEAEKRRENAR